VYEYVAGFYINIHHVMHKLVGWSIPKRVLGRLANLGILPSYEEVLILLDDANPAYD